MNRSTYCFTSVFAGLMTITALTGCNPEIPTEDLVSESRTNRQDASTDISGANPTADEPVPEWPEGLGERNDAGAQRSPNPSNPAADPDPQPPAQGGAGRGDDQPQNDDGPLGEDGGGARNGIVMECGDHAVCDDFEDHQNGAAPNPARWAVVMPNCEGDGAITVDDSEAHSGTQSLRVTGSGGYCNHVFVTPTVDVSRLAPVLYGRFYVKFGRRLDQSHVTFLSMVDEASGRDLRMGGQSEILMWNRESDDATLPELSPDGIAQSVRPVANEWTCVEFAVDGPAGTLQTWVNGDAVSGLTIDGEPTPDVDRQWLRNAGWRPTLADARFGWESYGASPGDLWFDDIALGTARIGCGDAMGVANPRGDRDPAQEPGRRPNAGGGDEDECETTEDFFERAVWNPILSTRCVGCHSEGAVASGTRLVLQNTNEAGWLENNLAAISTVLEVEDGLPRFLSKSTGQQAHAGGALVELDGADFRAMTALVARLNGEVDGCGAGEGPRDDLGPAEPMGDCAAPAPGRRMLRRLSHREYTNTIRDLMHLEADAEGAFAADVVVHGFDNNAAVLEVSPILADQYRTMAETLAEQADLDRLLPCRLNRGNADCARRFVTDFGLRLFRRPLTAEEIGRYHTLFGEITAESGFETGARWTLIALLQSPHFLYRTELGRRTRDGFELSSFELATALSYLFWQTTPDQILLDAAADGSLLEPEVLRAQADRLLDDPRSEATVLRFTEQWLGTDQLKRVNRDGDLFPGFNRSIRQSMARESELFIGDLWRNGGTLEDLLTADHTWVNAELAEYYGIEPGDGPADADGFRRVDLADEPYGGLLTLGAIMTTHSLPTSTSPIHRGKVVREQFFCQELPPPPMNINAAPPPLDPDLTTRERYAQHSADPACSGCHRLMDPIGFAFEHFDGAGKWREEDGGLEIDASGEVVQSAHSDGAFDGAQELSARLANSQDVQHCYIEKWVRYGYGADDSLPVGCYAKSLNEAFENAGGRLSGPLLALIEARHFWMRRGGDDELDVPGVDLVPQGPGLAPENAGDDFEGEEFEGADGGAGVGGNAPGITLELAEQSRWNSGYCVNGIVRNNGGAAVQWEVTGVVEGEINNAWNVELSANSGRITFSGVAHNNTVRPGGEAHFGFCANL